MSLAAPVSPLLSHEEIARLEAISFRSWPAASVHAHRGMLLRVTGGESRRSNSAALHACEPDLDIDEAISVAEAFYRERGLAPYFQIVPTAPRGFDEALAKRGYRLVAPTCVQTAAVTEVVRRAFIPAHTSAAILPAPDAAWIDVEVTRGRYADIGETFTRLFVGLGARASFGVARVDGEVAAACLAVHDEDVVFLAAMRTVPELRRRGAGHALVHAVGAWAEARGASLIYLQVEVDNAAAHALYAAAGFATRYGHHYRVLP